MCHHNFSGCERYSEFDDNPQNSIVTTIPHTIEIESAIAPETTVEKTTEFETNSPAKSKLSLSSIPSYSGNASVEVNDNVPFFHRMSIPQRVLNHIAI